MMADWELDGLMTHLRDHGAKAFFWLGGRDRATPLSTTKEIAEGIKGVTYEIEAELGHLLHETHPDRAAELIVKFINQQSA